MYIAVCGSEVDKTDGLTEARARLLGRVIASKGYTLLTGGCDGIPQAAVLGATERGGRCEAVSPAANLESHINDYNFPTEGFDDYHFLTDEYGTDQSIRKQQRCIPLVTRADAVIIAGGSSGTLLEFSIAYSTGKLIGVLEKSGGITTRVITCFLLDAAKETGSEVIFDENPKSLINYLTSSIHNQD